MTESQAVMEYEADGLDIEMVDDTEEIDAESVMSERVDSPTAPLIDRIVDAEEQCTRAELEVDAAKGSLKAAKTRYDACCLRLRQLVREIRNDEDRPLLKVMDASEEADDKWRSAPLSDLAISDGALSKLREAGVETIGELEDLRAKIADGKADWPKGIGEAKITMIENGVLQWLEVNRS